MLEQFESQHAASLIRNKMEIDTSETDVAACVEQFVRVFDPLMTDADRVRALVTRARKAGEWL